MPKFGIDPSNKFTGVCVGNVDRCWTKVVTAEDVAIVVGGNSRFAPAVWFGTLGGTIFGIVLSVEWA